jgi:hypothetical protein
MFQDGIEQVTIRTIGGPHPGNRIVPITMVGGKWPLPNSFPLDGGVYVKQHESDLTEEYAKHPNVSRGAAYKWSENDEKVG